MLHRVLLRLSVFIALTLAGIFVTGQLVVRYYKDDILNWAVKTFLPHQRITWHAIDIHSHGFSIHGLDMRLKDNSRVLAKKAVVTLDFLRPTSTLTASGKTVFAIKDIELLGVDILPASTKEEITSTDNTAPDALGAVEEAIETLNAFTRPHIVVRQLRLNGTFFFDPVWDNPNDPQHAHYQKKASIDLSGSYHVDHGHIQYICDIHDQSPQTQTNDSPFRHAHGDLKWMKDVDIELRAFFSPEGSALSSAVKPYGILIHTSLHNLHRIPWNLSLIQDTSPPLPLVEGVFILGGNTITLDQAQVTLALPHQPQHTITLTSKNPMGIDLSPLRLAQHNITFDVSRPHAPHEYPIHINLRNIQLLPKLSINIDTSSIDIPHILNLKSYIEHYIHYLKTHETSELAHDDPPIHGHLSLKGSLSLDEHQNLSAQGIINAAHLNVGTDNNTANAIRISDIALHGSYAEHRLTFHTDVTLTPPKKWNIDTLKPHFKIEGSVQFPQDQHESPHIHGTLHHRINIQPKVLAHLVPDNLYGDVEATLTLDGPLNQLDLKGQFHLNRGGYTHHAIGTFVKNIQAEGSLNGNHITLTTHATDGVHGTVHGKGSMTFPLPENIQTLLKNYKPVPDLTTQLNLNLSRFFIGQSDIFSGRGSGELNLEFPHPRIYGRVNLDKATVNLDPITPTSTPTLKPLVDAGSVEKDDDESPPTPFDFDIQVHTQNPMTVQGFGVNSTWMGQLNLKNHQPHFIGTFDIKHGSLDLTGQPFRFSKGHIRFDGKVKKPILDLEATRKIDSYDVFIKMQGRPKNPKFTFLSTPALTQEEIIALIVLGRKSDAASITQLLELSNSLSNLSSMGQNQNPFTQFRNALGIDALELKQSDEPTSTSGSSQALSIRKQLRPDIALVLEQTVQSSANGDKQTQATLEKKLGENWSVDVDLGTRGHAGVGLSWRKRY